MPVPSQMYTHALNPLKGWPSPYGLDIAGKLHEDVTIDPLPAGRCVHVSTLETPTKTGELPLPVFKTGVVGKQMGIFLLQGSDHFDVQNQGGTDWYAIAPKGIMSGLVATGGYELETTEFDTAQTYTPNQPLRARADDTNDADEVGGGCLTNQGVVFGTNAYVGVVSRGEFTNAYGKAALAFWPVYSPTSAA